MRVLFLIVMAVSVAACFASPEFRDGVPVPDAAVGMDSGAIEEATFQEGLNGYAGTHDSELNENERDRVFGNEPEFTWDLDGGRYALLRFDGLFGSNPGQIPVGATITLATLTITMMDMTDTPAGSVHAVLVSWDEQITTFNNFGAMPGVQSDDHGPELIAAPITTGASDLVVTETVQAWANSSADNWGWLVIPGSNNGASIFASESGTVDGRPRLTVQYLR